MPNERPSLDTALASYDRASAHEHIALGEQERKEVTALSISGAFVAARHES